LEDLISKVAVTDVDVPLLKPYLLSFATLTRLRSIQATLSLTNGLCRTAEVVPLPGYSHEGEAEILERVSTLAERGAGMHLGAYRNLLEAQIGMRNFALSPLLSAIDLFSYELCNITKDAGSTVTPVAAEKLDLSTIQDIPNGACIKVKLTGDPDLDAAAMRAIDDLSRTDVRYRLDANQAYTEEAADRFVSSIENIQILPQIDYLEQALPLEDWSGQKRLSQKFPFFNFMLDEGVFGREDIKRAHEIGVKFVKLKLFKQGGVKELMDQSRFAHELGLKVVVGNGVATAISNQVEISVYLANREWFYGPHEANGYLKTA
jgi:O-succinylbenzoate synthase